MELLPALAEERRSLVAVLEVLSAEQWGSPTLAAGWSVRHVVAHLVMPFRYSTPRFLVNMARARGNFDRMADRIARRDGALPPAELVAVLRANAANPWTPPGAGYEAPLTDLTMHSLDICRPLGIERVRPPRRASEVAAVVLNNLTSAQALKYFKLDLTGVAMQATDVGWRYGTGALVTGHSDDLILALGGRAAGLEGLSGPGLGLLTGGAGAVR